MICRMNFGLASASNSIRTQPTQFSRRWSSRKKHMLENFAPPFIWPVEDVQLALDLEAPWRRFIGGGDGSSVAGVVWGLDQNGVNALNELVAAGTRIKL